MHLIKDQTAQEIRSKCGLTLNPKTDKGQLTVWASDVTCPDCLERMRP